MEEEQFLFPTDSTMISFRGFFKKLAVVGHLFGVREGDTVDALEGGVVGVAEEVRSRVLEDRKGFDPARVGDVGATAEVDQGAAAVDRRRRVVRDLGLDQL